MVRLAILGSCVTADAAYGYPDDVRVVSYHSRTSFISLNSAPVAIAEDALPWASKFAKTVVLGDFGKTILPEMAECRPDAVVFDFIDDRHDLLRCGDSYVLRSEPLLDSGFPGSIPLKFERVERLLPETTRLWKKGCVAVMEKIREMLPEARLILHRCWWADEYRVEDAVHFFSKNERRENAAMNQMVAEYYSYCERAFPELRTVEVTRPRRAWAEHKWGLAPFHYEPEYGEELIRQIVRATAPSA